MQNPYEKFYKNKLTKIFYPESLVVKLFCSTKPIQYLDQKYKNKKILDLGCGNGRHSLLFDSLGFNTFPLETSKNISLKVEKFLNQKVYFGDSYNLPFKNKYFDYVFAFNSIYYVQEDKIEFSTILQHIKDKLKKRGVFIFTLIGNKHSFIKKNKKIARDKIIIKNDFLNFRNHTQIYYKKSFVKEIKKKFNIKFKGFLIDESKNFTRHLNYYVCQKY
jgi:SAM-dependent methyltransferase